MIYTFLSMLSRLILIQLFTDLCDNLTKIIKFRVAEFELAVLYCDKQVNIMQHRYLDRKKRPRNVGMSEGSYFFTRLS